MLISTDRNWKCGCWQWNGWDPKRDTRNNFRRWWTSDTGTPKTPNAQTSSSGDPPNLIEAIALLHKTLAVHGAGNNGQADTKVISSKPDTNTGSTYDEYLNEISQDLNKCKERGPPLNENIAKLFQKLVYN